MESIEECIEYPISRMSFFKPAYLFESNYRLFIQIKKSKQKFFRNSIEKNFNELKLKIRKNKLLEY